MKIKLGKTYITRDNRKKVRIICIDRKSKGGLSVIGLVTDDSYEEYTLSYYPDGNYLSSKVNDKDLVKEYSPWDNIEIDTKIFVRDDENDNWQYAYFAGYKEDKVCAFTHGSTSWSNKGIRYWKYAKLAEKD